MTIRQWLRKTFFNFGQSVPMDPARHLSALPLPIAASGITLTMDAATQLSVVWACMDAVTKGVASSPWYVYEAVGKNRTLLPDDPLNYQLNTRPNPEMTAISFKESLMYQSLSWGNAYAEIEFTLGGKVRALWPLLSDRVLVTRLQNADGTPGELVYNVYQYSGGWITLPAWKVYHVRGPSLNGFMGENMVARSAKAIAVAVAAERYASAYFANGTALGTVLKYPKTLTDAAHKRLQEDWEQKHQGPDRAYRPFILEGGMELDNIADDPEKAQLVETRKFSIEEICRFFGVPPHKVQHLERATFNNIEYLGLEFVRDALTPWALRLEQEADFKLLPQRSPWRVTKVDMEWLTQGDAKSRAEAYKVYRETGVYSVNDILAREGRNTIGAEGDVRIVPMNMTTMEGLSVQIEKLRAEIEKIKAPPPAPAPAGGGGALSGDMGGGDMGGKGAPPPGDGPPAADTVALASAGEALRASFSALVGGTLSRYQRRLQNREADLRRSARRTEIEVRARLVEEREATRPRAVEELQEVARLGAPLNQCARGLDVSDYILALDAVDSGAAVDTVTADLTRKILGA